MSFWQTVGVAVLLCAVIFITKDTRLSPLIIAASGILLFSLAFTRYAGIIDRLTALADAGGIRDELAFMLKAGGIALCAHLCAGMCRDMGQGTVADKVELIAKAEMIVISLPVIEELLALFV